MNVSKQFFSKDGLNTMRATALVILSEACGVEESISETY
ncbi:MAG: hypothetical protein ACI9Z7_001567 [Alteromonas macleodii]|jgi:hypothetical protein